MLERAGEIQDRLARADPLALFVIQLDIELDAPPTSGSAGSMLTDPPSGVFFGGFCSFIASPCPFAFGYCAAAATRSVAGPSSAFSPSAIRKANSIAWLAFSLGSQWV